jgi:hypothetical protein
MSAHVLRDPTAENFDELTTLHGKEATFLISRLRGPAPPEDPDVEAEQRAEAAATPTK